MKTEKAQRTQLHISSSAYSSLLMPLSSVFPVKTFVPSDARELFENRQSENARYADRAVPFARGCRRHTVTYGGEACRQGDAVDATTKPNGRKFKRKTTQASEQASADTAGRENLQPNPIFCRPLC